MKKTKGFTTPHQISIIDPEMIMLMWKKNRWMRPERVMALGFLALILLGGVLLEMNGQRYDNTLKNRLQSIHSAMVQGA